MTRQRIGVMGGSFDPIHLGHLAAATQVATRMSLDLVVLSPAGEAWHKDLLTAPAELRYQMTAVAVADEPGLSVTRVDIDRPGPTYTVDTLRDVAREQEPRGEADWFFITGADALSTFLTWHQPLDVLAVAHLVGVTRPGSSLVDPGLPSGSVTLIDIPALDISSSDIRDRVRRGEPIDHLVPDGVNHLIAEHRLYRDS